MAFFIYRKGVVDWREDQRKLTLKYQQKIFMLQWNHQIRNMFAPVVENHGMDEKSISVKANLLFFEEMMDLYRSAKCVLIGILSHW